MQQIQLSQCMRLGTPVARRVLRHGYGFSAREAERLIDLKIRYEGGKLQYTSSGRKHLEFYRWLDVHGRLDDDCRPHVEPDALAA
ncbi:MAG: hypothetical protein M3P51_12420 [Chloroflexota bacterium]|nr:hypothetical protein [Chloroflexota bacterium]